MKITGTIEKSLSSKYSPWDTVGTCISVGLSKFWVIFNSAKAIFHNIQHNLLSSCPMTLELLARLCLLEYQTIIKLWICRNLRRITHQWLFTLWCRCSSAQPPNARWPWHQLFLLDRERTWQYFLQALFLLLSKYQPFTIYTQLQPWFLLLSFLY